MSSSVEERVKKLICEQLGVKEDEVNDDASFVEDLGADSLDTVSLVMVLEEEFETEIPDEEAEKDHDRSQAIDYVLAPVNRYAARPHVGGWGRRQGRALERPGTLYVRPRPALEHLHSFAVASTGDRP